MVDTEKLNAAASAAGVGGIAQQHSENNCDCLDMDNDETEKPQMHVVVPVNDCCWKLQGPAVLLWLVSASMADIFLDGMAELH